MNALFVKFYRFMLPTLVYKIWPPSQLPRTIQNHFDLWPFMETWPDMAHVPPRILILHMPPASKARHSKQLAINALHILKVDHLAEIRLLEHIKTLHVIIDPNIFRVKTSQHYSHHNSSNINLLKMQTFSHAFQSRKTF